MAGELGLYFYIHSIVLFTVQIQYKSGYRENAVVWMEQAQDRLFRIIPTTLLVALCVVNRIYIPAASMVCIKCKCKLYVITKLVRI